VTQLEARLQVPVDPADLLPVPPAAAYATLAALTSAVPAASADTRKYYRVTDGAGEVLYRSDGSTWNLVGTEDSAKLEQVLLVEADKTEGLSAQYTLKVSAGKAIAGFGIAATERDGVPESAFIVQADQFALTTPYTFSQEATPTATAIGQTWYKPSTLISYRATATGTGNWVVYTPVVPFVVDTTTGSVYITGTLRVGGSSAPTFTTVGSATTNFNGRNDRNATAVVAPTIASDGTAIDHTINTDGSADFSLEWSWAGTEADIDGFVVTVYSAATNAAYTFGTTPAAEQKYVVPADKRAILGYGIAADRYYKFSVQAYRTVDPDVNAAGILLSARAIPSLAAENPYRPDANVAFAGNVSGTVSGVAAATVVAGAADGATALSAVNNVTTGLATKLGAAQKNILSGEGGIRTGTIDWDVNGDNATGAGIAITSKGILGRNSTAGAAGITFTIDGTTGAATFKGDITGASGTFSGNLNTAGQVLATGTTSSAEGSACVVGNSSSSGVRGGVFIATNTTGAVGSSSSGTGLYGKTGSTSSAAPGVLGTAGSGGYAFATETGSIIISASNANMIIGPATNTGANNLVIKEGSAGARLNDQLLIYGQLSADNETTLGLVVEQDVEAGTGSFTGLVQLRIHINGVAYKLPLEAY
jgi:hypothetical protein